VPAHVARERAVVRVIAAAGAAADDQVDLPALVEVLDGLGGGSKRMQRKRQQGGAETQESIAFGHAHPRNETDRG
jgi:hypothetical protein